MGNQAKLQQQISEISNDSDFIAACESMDIHTVGDIMVKGSAGLRQHPKFTMMWYAVVLRLLDKEDLLDEFERVR